MKISLVKDMRHQAFAVRHQKLVEQTMTTLLSERMMARLHLVLIPGGFAVPSSEATVQSNMGAMQSIRLVCQVTPCCHVSSEDIL